MWKGIPILQSRRYRTLSNERLLIGITAILIATCSSSPVHCDEDGLLTPLARVPLDPVATLKKKQWPVFFSTIQSELKDRWKLEVERSNAPPPTVTENSIDVSFTSKTTPYSLVNVYLDCAETAEQAARGLREKRFGGLRRISGGDFQRTRTNRNETARLLLGNCSGPPSENK